jgi:hypothetical protein
MSLSLSLFLGLLSVGVSKLSSQLVYCWWVTVFSPVTIPAFEVSFYGLANIIFFFLLHQIFAMLASRPM